MCGGGHTYQKSAKGTIFINQSSGLSPRSSGCLPPAAVLATSSSVVALVSSAAVLTVSVATTVTTAVSAVATTTRRWAISALAGDVDGDVAALEVLAVHGTDGLISIILVDEGEEAESTVVARAQAKLSVFHSTLPSRAQNL